MSLLSDLARLRLPKGPWQFGQATSDGKNSLGHMLKLGSTVLVNPMTKKPAEVPMAVLFQAMKFINVSEEQANAVFVGLQHLPTIIETLFKMKDIVLSFAALADGLRALPGFDAEMLKELDALVEAVKPLVEDADVQPAQIIVPG